MLLCRSLLQSGSGGYGYTPGVPPPLNYDFNLFPPSGGPSGGDMPPSDYYPSGGDMPPSGGDMPPSNYYPSGGDMPPSGGDMPPSNYYPSGGDMPPNNYMPASGGYMPASGGYMPPSGGPPTTAICPTCGAFWNLTLLVQPGCLPGPGSWPPWVASHTFFMQTSRDHHMPSFCPSCSLKL